MNDHAYFEVLVAASVDGTLTEAEREALHTHLAECPACASLLEDLKQMQQLLDEDSVQMPASLHEKIMTQVQQETRLTMMQPEKPKRHIPVFSMVACAAVVVMVVLSGGVSQLFGTAPVSGATMAVGENTEVDSGIAQARIAMPEDASFSETTDAATPEAQLYDAAADQTDAATEQQTDEIDLPEMLTGMNVSCSYLAQGSGELPEIAGTLLVTVDDRSYFTLQNNMSVIEQTLNVLEQAGFTVAAYKNTSLILADQAKEWLLIVQRNG